MQDIVDKKFVSSEAAAAADGNSLKLRTYLPVLRAYCDEENCSATLKLFTRMRNSPGVVLEPGKLFFFSTVRQSNFVAT
jgi:pentatricopeptide repeat protein